MSLTTTEHIQQCLERMKGGDATAREELIECACERLRVLTRRMLKKYGRLRRWEDTDDVLQNAVMRLYRSLAAITPATPVDFFRLASVNIRRELLDLVKHHFGPLGLGKNYASDENRVVRLSDRDDESPHSSELDDLAMWEEFHEAVATLPEDLREIVDLLWYQGLTQAEAADALGCSVRTVKRRWLSGRLALCETLGVKSVAN